MTRIEALPPAQQREYRLMHDARAASDTARFRFADFETDGLPSWVVATVIPDPDSGSATIPGGYIKAETGEVVIPEGVAPVILKKGTWQAVATVTPAQPIQGRYSWSEPLEQEKRVFTPEDYYSPFGFGGTIVFRPTPGTHGIEEFDPVRLIFPEWSGLIEPAFKQLSQSDYSLYGKFASVVDHDRIAQLVSHTNGLIAAIALRELIRTLKTTPQRASNFLDTTDDRRRSIFAYIMVALSPPDKLKEFAQIVANRVQAATQLFEIQTIALGAFAAALFHGEPEVIAEGRSILKAARRRVQGMSGTGERAAQLLLMFKQMGIEIS